MLEWGCAIEHTPGCFQTVRALLCLASITGNIDQPGSWAFGMLPLPPFPQLFDKMPMAQQKKRLGFDEFKVLSGELAQLPSAHIPAVFKAIRTNDPYPVLACKDEYVGNQIKGYSAPQPLHGHKWIDILSRERGRYPTMDIAYVPIMCNHCDEAPCIEQGAGAVEKRQDGIVIINPEKAAGRKGAVDVRHRSGQRNGELSGFGAFRRRAGAR
jgi:hypothetical protein